MADKATAGPGSPFPPLAPTSASAPAPARPALVLRPPTKAKAKAQAKPKAEDKHELPPGDELEATGREESFPFPASIRGIKTSSPSPPPSSPSFSSTRRGKQREKSQISNPNPLHRKPEFGLTDIEVANILPPMAARNRPRGPPQRDDAADAHEERNMWNQIQTDLGRLKIVNAKAKEVADQIIKMEAEMGSCA